MNTMRWMAVAAAALWAAPAAYAQGFVIGGPSPRTGAVEVKLGFVKPLLDAESDTGPYATILGKGGMLLVELETDWYLYQGIGAAGLTFSAGYAEKYTHAKVVDEAGNPTNEEAEATGLMILPLRLGGVYRFDWAAQNYRVPLVPYVKANLVLTPWWSMKGGEIEVFNGNEGVGAKWGYGGTLGIAILLDMLDPRLARDFDTDLGVNHTYLFAEYNYANVNSFDPDGLDLSTRHWMFGLTFEF